MLHHSKPSYWINILKFPPLYTSKIMGVDYLVIVTIVFLIFLRNCYVFNFFFFFFYKYDRI